MVDGENFVSRAQTVFACVCFGCVHVCVCVGYGQSGPRSQTPGYDSIASAMSGMMHITGPEVSLDLLVVSCLSSVLSGLFWLSFWISVRSTPVPPNWFGPNVT